MFVNWQSTASGHFLCNPTFALFSQVKDFLANLNQVAETIFWKYYFSQRGEVVGLANISRDVVLTRRCWNASKK